MNANHVLCLGLLATLGSAWAKPGAKPAAQPPSTEKIGAVAPATPLAPDGGMGITDPQPLPESDFKKFEPPGESFSVMIPKNAIPEHFKDRSGKNGPGVWVVNGSIGKYNFVFAQVAVDAQTRAMAGSNESLLSGFIEAFVEASRGTLKSMTPMKYKGTNAAELVIKGPKNHVMGLMVSTGDFIYHLMFTHDGTPPAYAKAYLDSLEFQPTSPGGDPVGTKK